MVFRVTGKNERLKVMHDECSPCTFFRASQHKSSRRNAHSIIIYFSAWHIHKLSKRKTFSCVQKQLRLIILYSHKLKKKYSKTTTICVENAAGCKISFFSYLWASSKNDFMIFENISASLRIILQQWLYYDSLWFILSKNQFW